MPPFAFSICFFVSSFFSVLSVTIFAFLSAPQSIGFVVSLIDTQPHTPVAVPYTGMPEFRHAGNIFHNQ